MTTVELFNKLSDELIDKITKCEDEIKKYQLENLKIKKQEIKMWFGMTCASIMAGAYNLQDLKTAILASAFTGVALSNEILKVKGTFNFKEQKEYNNKQIRKNKDLINLLLN